MTNKQFLLATLVVYVVGCIIGVAVFKSPGYSKEYLAKYGPEHEYYLKVLENEEFHLYEQRPALYPTQIETLAADFAFAEHYKENPEFRAERRRMFFYEWYFKILNVVIFTALMLRFVKKPLLDALDARIADIRQNMDSAEKEAGQAAKLEQAAKSKVDQWAQTAHEIQQQTEQMVVQNLAQIEQEFELGKKQVEKETADRKNAELYRAARTVRQEMVEEMLRQIEERHKSEATHERLAANVNQFVQLMDRLS